MTKQHRLNGLVERYCDDRGYQFKPWDITPWTVMRGEQCPYPHGTAGAATWPKALQLREKILAELGEQES